MYIINILLRQNHPKCVVQFYAEKINRNACFKKQKEKIGVVPIELIEMQQKLTIVTLHIEVMD